MRTLDELLLPRLQIYPGAQSSSFILEQTFTFTANISGFKGTVDESSSNPPKKGMSDSQRYFLKICPSNYE